MNSSRCSRLVVALLVLAVLAVPVAAVNVAEEDVPGEEEVNAEVQGSVTLDNLYQDPDVREWTLEGETELENASWQVIFYDETGSQIGQERFQGANFSLSGINRDRALSLEVTVEGDAPAVEEYTYPEEETFTTMALTQAYDGRTNEVGTWETHHYTTESEEGPGSQEARNALDDARDTIDEADEAGANVENAEDTFDHAVSSYENGNFENAIDLADSAGASAEESRQQMEQSQQRNQLLLFGGVGLVVLLAVVGGVYWYRSQQGPDSKLR